jgi:hypothetical protein
VTIVAVIVPKDGESIPALAWESLIPRHSSLALSEVKTGVNPFTKEPVTVPPRRDYARVVIDGLDVGCIEWALDGSDMLLVRAETNADAVIAVGAEVAQELGAILDEKHDVVVFNAPVDSTQSEPEDPTAQAVRLWKEGNAADAVAIYGAVHQVGVAEALATLKKLAEE